MKFREHIQKIKKKHIIYSILISIFIVILVLYLYSRFVPGNFIENLYENNKWNEELSYIDFLKNYIDSFFIYAFSALILLWIANIILHVVEKKVSPDVHNTLHVLIRVIIIPVFVIAYLNKFDAYTGALIGVAATLGAAFGIAAARSVSDLISGLYMVFSKHHNVGDYIIIPGMELEGIVKSISVNYLELLKSDGSTAIIPNTKLRNEQIINTVIVKAEKERDGITDFFLYGRRVTETQYVYPLKWSSDSEDSHEKCVKAIEKTAKQFKDYLEEEIVWQISQRDRFHRTYLISLLVLDPETLLTLVGNFANALEKNYELLKNKK